MQRDVIVIELVIRIVCSVILPLLVNPLIKRKIKQKDAYKEKLKLFSEFFRRMEKNQRNVTTIELENMLSDADETFEEDEELMEYFHPVQIGLIWTLRLNRSGGCATYDFTSKSYSDFKIILKRKCKGAFELFQRPLPDGYPTKGD